MSGQPIQSLKNISVLTFPGLQETEKCQGKVGKISRIGKQSDSISVIKSMVLAAICADCAIMTPE